MIGQNMIEMNQATINEAVEHYLNTRVFREGRQVKVLSVDEDANNGVFNVTIEPLIPAESKDHEQPEVGEQT